MPSSAGTRRKRRTRSRNSTTSSSAKALSSDSIGTRWTTLANFAEGAAPDRDGDGALELGEARLDREDAATEPIVFRVGDDRSVFLEIRLVVLGDLAREALPSRGGLLLIEVLHGLLGDTLLGHLLPGTAVNVEAAYYPISELAKAGRASPRPRTVSARLIRKRTPPSTKGAPGNRNGALGPTK